MSSGAGASGELIIVVSQTFTADVAAGAVSVWNLPCAAARKQTRFSSKNEIVRICVSNIMQIY